MKPFVLYGTMALLAAGTIGSGAWATSDQAATSRSAAMQQSTVLNLADVKQNPKNYSWFEFKPNLNKLILAGAADTRHVSLLWYTIPTGSVGLHYHAMTESVYVIDGTQTDAKGTYPTGSLYFNPPGSGHAIKDSSGFFLLAYTSPPDFSKTALIGEYTPVVVNTGSPQLERDYAFTKTADGAKLHRFPLDPKGGMTSELIRVEDAASHTYSGNYLLPLSGSCKIEGQDFTPGMLIVAKTVQPQSWVVRASKGAVCMTLGVSF